MKKISLYVWIFALCLSVFCCERSFSAIAVKSPAHFTAYPSINLEAPSSVSVLRSPLSMVFPFESLNHTICRKPISLFWINTSFENFYFSNVKLATPAASNLQLDQDILFQSGHSYLLVPQKLTLQFNNGFRPMTNPTLQVRKPD